MTTGTTKTTQERKSAAPILVVDDNPDIRQSIVDVLEQEGYSTVQAENGAEALRHLRGGRRPRLIILDLTMPVMDGWQFHREMQANTEFAGIPVIVASAHHHDEKPVPVAASQFIRKPFEPQELLAMVTRYCR